MKKGLIKGMAVLFSLCMTVSMLSGCGDKKEEDTNKQTITSTASSRLANRDKVKANVGSSSRNNTDDNKKKADEKKSDAETQVLVYAENQPEDYPTTLGAYELARIVKEKTDGRITIDVKANGVLGDEQQVVKKVQDGEVDMMRVSLAPMATYLDDLNVLLLPYIYRDSEHMWKVLDGDIGQTFLNNLADTAGVMGLCWYDAGARNFYISAKEIKSPEDLKGLKIRMQNNPLMLDLATAFGAEAIPLGYADVLPALQNKEIDGAENGWPSYISTEHYKYAKYIAQDAHTRAPEMVIMNNKLYDSLSEEDKVIFKEAALLSSELQREEWNKEEEKAMKTAKEEGCVITEVNSADFQKVVEPLYEKYASDKMDIVEEIQSIE